MAAKRYTVLIIPSNSSRTRRFGFSRRAFVLALLVLVVSVGSGFGLLADRAYLVGQLTRLGPLQERAEAQKAALERFSLRLEELDKELVRLRKLEEQLRVMASLRPKGKSDDFGVGGVNPEESLAGLEALDGTERRVAARLTRQVGDMERRAADRQSAFEEILREFLQKRVLLAHTPSITPVEGGWLTSGFGNRVSAFTGKDEFHAGLDIVAREGTPVVSPADGVVVKEGSESGYGKIIEISHTPGVITRYAHNQKNLVRVGQRVRRGDVIAAVGRTGRSTGPHLHYEVRLNGVAVNPLIYIVDEVLARR